MMKKLFLISVWMFSLFLGGYSVFKTTPIASLAENVSLQINFFQRVVGILAFVMLTFQIILGANMERLIQKLGSWVFSFHKLEGVVAYSFILLHPLSFVFFNFKLFGRFDPFYVFTDFCVLCKTTTEGFYTLGRVAFWLVTVAVAAALFRNHPLIRKNWRRLHTLNYIVYYLIVVHSLGVGSDTKVPPFFYFFVVSVVAVTFTLLGRFNVLRRLTKGKA